MLVAAVSKLGPTLPKYLPLTRSDLLDLRFRVDWL